MANPADKYAKKTFGQLESQMSKQYREAYKDISKKLQDFTRRHKAKDKQMQRDLKKGKITQEQYASWLRGQVFIGQQWQDAKASLDLSIKNVMTETAHLTHQKSIDVFVDNANYTAYQIEKDHGFTGGINFTIYDRKTVSRLMLEDPELLPRGRDINGNKLSAWNTKVIANCVTQSILQGESIDELSKRIARDTCIDAGRSSLLYARTAMTGAQNAGRVERMKEAEEMGIKVQKQWMSTLDSRTRDSHRDMDGEIADTDEEFSNGLEYPGDPSGDPREVYNCRCTLIYHYPEYSDYSKMERTAYYEEGDPEYDPDHRNYEIVKGMDYEKWVDYKQDQIRQRYGGEAKAPVPEVKPKEEEHPLVRTDEELQAQRDESKRLDQERKDISNKRYKTWSEEDEVDKKLRELREERKRLDDLAIARGPMGTHYPEYDIYKTKEEYEAYRREESDQLTKLYGELDQMKRPRRDEFSTDEAYEKAYDEWHEKRQDIRDQIETIERRYFTEPDWSKISTWREARDLGESGIEERRKELNRRADELLQKKKDIQAKRERLSKQFDEITEKSNTWNEARVVDTGKADKVEYREPKSNLFGGTKPTTDEIVARIAGGDMTDGSCVSVGFAYVGQKEGWDVLDFRGQPSEDMFAYNARKMLRGIAVDTEKPLLYESTKTGTGGAIKLVRGLQEGKEYYLITGSHASVVRRVGSEIQYMELQSSWKNGWRHLGTVDDRDSLDRGFRSRFGSSNSKNGEALAMDIEDMKGSKMLHRIYGYVNTEESKQKKGSSGHER